MNITRIKMRIDNLLWKKDLSKLPSWQAHSIHIIRILQAVYRDLSGGLPTLRAMSLVYTTLLSLVPLLAVSFSVLKGMGAHNQIKPMLLNVLSPLGSGGVEITEHLLNFVDNIKVGVLGFIGVALLFYTVISLIQKIERAFNFTWRITSYRSIGQRFSDYLSVIMVGPVLVFLAIGITASISSSSLVETLSAIEPFGTLLVLLGKIIPYILIIAAFTFIYSIIPNTKVQFKSALTGAIIAGLLWETTGWMFTSFVANSANYTAVYSSFAVLMIFMIWLYLSWLILLIGASIAYYHQYPERISIRQQKMRLSCRLREKIAMLVMFKIADHFYFNKSTLWTQTSLAKSLEISNEAIGLVIDSLEEKKLIMRCGENNDEFTPSKSLEHISVKDIWDSIREAEEAPYLNPSKLESIEAIDELLNNTDLAIQESFASISLLDIIKKQQALMQ